MHPLTGADAETLLCHFGEEDKPHGAVVPPIYQNSLFTFDTVEEFIAAGPKANVGDAYVYSRIGNPTVAIAERKIAKLEGTEACRVFSSGMAAISCCVMNCIESGAHVVAVDTCYGPLRSFLVDYLPRFGVTCTFVDGACVADVADAIRPETKLVYLESPGSLVFRLQDIEAITRLCREKGIYTAIDNTYSTPLYQSPAAMGVDFILHSATKYLGGHSDIVAGVVAGPSDRLEKMTQDEVATFGSLLPPFPAWLLTRGLRTLAVRVKRHEESANEIAKWLEEHPSVELVNHVSLPSFKQRDLYLKQMRGSTGLFSFQPKKQDRKAIIRFVEALKIFQLGVSWGGFESLCVPLEVSPIYIGEMRQIIRLFIGLESPRDLMADLKQAFEVSGL